MNERAAFGWVRDARGRWKLVFPAPVPRTWRKDRTGLWHYNGASGGRP